MPELPEVETTLRGLKPHLENAMIYDIIVRQYQLRWPIPSNIKSKIKQQYIRELSRRGKYLLLHLKMGTMLIHLGMSGSLRIVNDDVPAQKHDHVDIILSNHKIMRYTDPRRFGALLLTTNDPRKHPLLQSLGVEPLDACFESHYLLKKIKNRCTPIKSFIMNNKIVVGVGNIYASEALFLAGIHPLTPAGNLNEKQCKRLVKSIQQILTAAIKRGGTTLKDFMNSDGKPGYFGQNLKVYGRRGLPCVKCHTILEFIKIGQRSTVLCCNCQPVTFIQDSQP